MQHPPKRRLVWAPAEAVIDWNAILSPPGFHALPRRWCAEVAHSWFNRFRRLPIRWEKKGLNYLALVHLAAILIIYRKLRHAHLLFG